MQVGSRAMLDPRLAKEHRCDISYAEDAENTTEMIHNLEPLMTRSHRLASLIIAMWGNEEK